MKSVGVAHDYSPGVKVLTGAGRFREGIPTIVVVDDFYERPEAVREFALGCEFVEGGAYHKGRRTKERYLLHGLKERFEDLLGGGVRIRGWLDHRYNGVFGWCGAGDPVVFHSDSQMRAAVVYLTPHAPVECGTVFVKSKATGLRRAPTEKDVGVLGGAPAADVAVLERLTYQGKLLDAGAWEVVDRVGNVFNRLVIWDAKMIHAAGGYFGGSKDTGRLFHLFFFDLE